MNRVVILTQKGDPDDGMFTAYGGCTNGFGEEKLVTINENADANRFVGGFLRENGSSLVGASIETVLKQFLEHVEEITIYEDAVKGAPPARS